MITLRNQYGLMGSMLGGGLGQGLAIGLGDYARQEQEEKKRLAEKEEYTTLFNNLFPPEQQKQPAAAGLFENMMQNMPQVGLGNDYQFGDLNNTSQGLLTSLAPEGFAARAGSSWVPEQSGNGLMSNLKDTVYGNTLYNLAAQDKDYLPALLAQMNAMSQPKGTPESRESYDNSGNLHREYGYWTDGKWLSTGERDVSKIAEQKDQGAPNYIDELDESGNTIRTYVYWQGGKAIPAGKPVMIKAAEQKDPVSVDKVNDAGETVRTWGHWVGDEFVPVREEVIKPAGKTDEDKVAAENKVKADEIRRQIERVQYFLDNIESNSVGLYDDTVGRFHDPKSKLIQDEYNIWKEREIKKLNGSGVLTDADYERFKKVIPSLRWNTYDGFKTGMQAIINDLQGRLRTYDPEAQAQYIQNQDDKKTANTNFDRSEEY